MPTSRRTLRSNDATPRDWAAARARIAAQRDRADNQSAPDAGNRPGGNRGNDSPPPSWKRDDNNRDRDNRDRGHQGRDNQGRDWRNDPRGDHDNRWSNSRGNHDNRNDHDRDNRHDDRRDWGRDHRDWDRNSWRRDNRYDWRHYRENHRSIYRIGRYYAPYHGYSYRRLGIGFSLGSIFYGNRYWISDPWSYRLPAVYGPYRWVRYYDDVLLVNIYTGQVVDVIYDFFW
ncbi:RcnB family protein [Novosphingobium sp. CF614]|uniref:RcnB family protein n=1 Tax=Novosphingobium sp. CF614 TaxID=1884364 RepID=UPI0015A5FBC7|nr:RcnB family protein [Novosphingobium sp. CF614]